MQTQLWPGGKFNESGGAHPSQPLYAPSFPSSRTRKGKRAAGVCRLRMAEEAGRFWWYETGELELAAEGELAGP